MLEEYKTLYQQEADKIAEWKKINKNQLCNLFINETNKEKKNSYFSAIVCNYWYMIAKYYNMSKNIAQIEDVYGWLIDTIMYVLDNHVWTNPNSSLYKDPNGPDKAINRNISCRRYTAYQTFNRQKRKPSYLNVSWDDIADRCEIDTLMEDFDSPINIDINNLIRNCFLKQQYMTAFIIDNIAYGNTFKTVTESVKSAELEKKENKKSDREAIRMAKCDEKGKDYTPVYAYTISYNVFSPKKLVSRLKNLSEDDASFFASRYGLPEDVVEDKLINYCKNCSNSALKKLIDTTLQTLKLNFNRGNLGC